MKKYRVLYNPHAGCGRGRRESEKLLSLLPGDELRFFDITQITDMEEFFSASEDTVIIAGGDGTLNRLVNEVEDLPDDIMYFACGTGNDFLHDLGKRAPCPPFPVKKYLAELPTVTVNGVTRRFINGIGYGIDGYCCEEGDRVHNAGKKKNYILIALKGLIYDFKPTDATVFVDGAEHTYRKVWLAPTMNGKYFGGGMKIAPMQKRGEGNVTLLVGSGVSNLRILLAFPRIFKGTHVKLTKILDIFSAREVTVRFDRPTPLQIDGETFRAVSEYTVRAGAGVLAESDVDKVLVEL